MSTRATVPFLSIRSAKSSGPSPFVLTGGLREARVALDNPAVDVLRRKVALVPALDRFASLSPMRPVSVHADMLAIRHRYAAQR